MQDVKVYGATWCHDTRDTIAHLEERKVPFEFIDIDEDADGLEWVKRQNGGKQKLPTVDVGGVILSVPDADELDAALQQGDEAIAD